MEIIILGTGCAKCKTLYERVSKVIKNNNVVANLTKEEDIVKIMAYNIMTLPALVVDGAIKIKGSLPSEAEIYNALNL